MKRICFVLCFLAVTLTGCRNSTSGNGQAATIVLKDGTTVAGTVTKSDSSSVTLQTANGVVSTYPISQVASVNYETAANATPAAPQQTAAAPTLAPPDGS